MVFGEVGETVELFIMIGAVILSIAVILWIQNLTGTGSE